jgi:hypothetical protein
MKNTKHVSAAQAHKKTQPEEFDLVILGGGTGSTIAASCNSRYSIGSQ